jgi:hypothetical protein
LELVGRVRPPKLTHSFRAWLKFYDQVTLIDAGGNTTTISCSNCDGDIAVGWFFALIEKRDQAFGNLQSEVPCCGTVMALD